MKLKKRKKFKVKKHTKPKPEPEYNEWEMVNSVDDFFADGDVAMRDLVQRLPVEGGYLYRCIITEPGPHGKSRSWVCFAPKGR